MLHAMIRLQEFVPVALLAFLGLFLLTYDLREYQVGEPEYFRSMDACVNQMKGIVGPLRQNFLPISKDIITIHYESGGSFTCEKETAKNLTVFRGTYRIVKDG
ncbi:MAG: hypothetical protein KTR21_05455 [Rhodobacteraceae bacterium]|nr:hypothetical protein [Paracoccaceae bacterium]